VASASRTVGTPDQTIIGRRSRVTSTTDTLDLGQDIVGSLIPMFLSGLALGRHESDAVVCPDQTTTYRITAALDDR
jgi:hypothetical protein